MNKQTEALNICSRCGEVNPAEIHTCTPKEALEQSRLDEMQSITEKEYRKPAQEPVAWMSKKRGDVSKAKMYFNEGEEILPLYTHPAPPSLPDDLEFAYQRGYRAGVNSMKPAQEPVPLIRHENGNFSPAPLWKGLSDDERHEVIVKHVAVDCTCDPYEFARAIEQELRTKNGFSDVKEKNYG